ncbi:protein of unknown function [Methylorubrum extorquens DM4]|uniref:Uncharacterized protein n=1 Tax=Methylorubrum extorquens (strain DSM 6343 / CIP 106787 / DM4) TaxID=661410 RepID=C7CIQ9_METED|nr:protein of unknown function [Methylorubrum extorquens DM4]
MSERRVLAVACESPNEAAVSSHGTAEPAAGPSRTGWPSGPQGSAVETGDGDAEQEPRAGRAAFLGADPGSRSTE